MESATSKSPVVVRKLQHFMMWFGFLFLFHLAYVAIIHNFLLQLINVRQAVVMLAQMVAPLAALGFLLFGLHFLLSTPLLWLTIGLLKKRMMMFSISGRTLVAANLLLTLCFGILFWIFASVLKGFWSMAADRQSKLAMNDLGSATNLLLESISLIPSVFLACIIIGIAKWWNRRTQSSEFRIKR